MNNELVLRPATIPLAVRSRGGAAVVLRVAWQLILWAAPAMNLNWCVGLAPYENR